MKVRFLFVCAMLLSVSMSPGTAAPPAMFDREEPSQRVMPVASISGPQEARSGDIIILDASASVGDHFSWLVDDSEIEIPRSRVNDDTDRLIRQLRGLGVKVEDPASSDRVITHLILDNGRRVVLSSYRGRWKIVLAVSNSNGIKQIPWRVTVDSDSTPPSPNPTPPVVTPPVPTPQFGLKISVSEWIAAVPPASRSQSAVVASVIEGVAIDAVEGRLNSIEAAEAAMFVALSASMDAGVISKEDWAGFGSKLMDSITALKAIGKIASVVDFGFALKEVVEGLR